MKRMIKYHSIYASDGPRFSTSSTRYEILPNLYDDSAGIPELKARAKELGLRTNGIAKDLKETNGWREIQITEAIILAKKVEGYKRNYCDKKGEMVTQYLGFVKIVECHTLTPRQTINNTAAKDSLYEIINGCDAYRLGIEDCGEAENGEYWLIMSGWHFYHHIPLLGYSLDKFFKANKVDDTYFYDSVNRCTECGVYDTIDDGYHYNHRDGVGINCGCFAEYSVSNIDDWANEPSKCVEPDTIKTLEKADRIEFIERFVGGMTDSWRSHSYAGVPVRIGDPTAILAELLDKEPDGNFIFSHDESGQFQTYFSVYRLLPVKPVKSSKGKRRTNLKAVGGTQ